MSEVVATLIGAVIGAIAALGGGIATEWWRNRHAEDVAVRLIFDELRVNYFRLAALRDDGLRRLSTTGRFPSLMLQHSGWQVHGAAVAQSDRGKRVWQHVQEAHIALEVADYFASPLDGAKGEELLESKARWQIKTGQALKETMEALSELKKTYTNQPLSIDDFITEDYKKHGYK
jgi:hypothetical protein